MGFFVVEIYKLFIFIYLSDALTLSCLLYNLLHLIFAYVKIISYVWLIGTVENQNWLSLFSRLAKFQFEFVTRCKKRITRRG